MIFTLLDQFSAPKLKILAYRSIKILGFLFPLVGTQEFKLYKSIVWKSKKQIIWILPWIPANHGCQEVKFYVCASFLITACFFTWNCLYYHLLFDAAKL